MNTKIRIIFIIIFLPLTVFAQNSFFIGNKTYDSTDEFELKSNQFIGGQNLKVTIAKNNESGLLIVSCNLYADFLRIKGKLLIYLDDKSIITCLDKNKYDYVDNTATTVYYLTKDEIDQLKSSNIYSIRFSIASIQQYATAPSIGAHSVRNYPKKEFFETNRIDFPKIISELF